MELPPALAKYFNDPDRLLANADRRLKAMELLYRYMTSENVTYEQVKAQLVSHYANSGMSERNAASIVTKLFPES